MSEKDISDEESALFRQACKHVTPLNQPQRVRKTIRKRKPMVQPPSQRTHAPAEVVLGLREYPYIAPEEIVSFNEQLLTKKQLRQLKQNDFSVTDRLDLHGMTLSEAESYLKRTLDNLSRQGKKYLLIIHGKGKIQHDRRVNLKSFLNVWLREQPQILAFMSAQAKHGGTGAVYVLLRRFKTRANYVPLGVLE